MFLPRRPTGTSPNALFLQWVYDKFTQLDGITGDGSTVKIRKSRNAIVFSAQPQGSSSQPVQGPFAIQSVQGDHLVCLPFDFTTNKVTSQTPVNIALEPLHRQTLSTLTIFGVVHNFTYVNGATPPGGLQPADVNNIFRVDTFSGTTEYQRIIPPWTVINTADPNAVPKDIVWAIEADTGVFTGDNVPVALLIDGRSCQWGQVTQ